MRLNTSLSSNALKKSIRITAKDKQRDPGKPRSVRRAPPVALLREHFTPDEICVAFTYYNPAAREVFLAGTFNDWKPFATRLVEDANGVWAVELHLKPGTYEYRLIVDGVWQEDPMAARFVANPFGGLNSVIVVKGDNA